VSDNSFLGKALLTQVVLVIFLVLTVRKRPYVLESLFDLELLSLAIALFTVYCGLFNLTDSSHSDIEFASTPQSFLLPSLICANCIFFIYWLFRVLYEL
jgi:hypothetical protein